MQRMGLCGNKLQQKHRLYKRKSPGKILPTSLRQKLMIAELPMEDLLSSSHIRAMAGILGAVVCWFLMWLPLSSLRVTEAREHESLTAHLGSCTILSLLTGLDWATQYGLQLPSCSFQRQVQDVAGKSFFLSYLSVIFVTYQGPVMTESLLTFHLDSVPLLGQSKLKHHILYSEIFRIGPKVFKSCSDFISHPTSAYRINFCLLHFQIFIDIRLMYV